MVRENSNAVEILKIKERMKSLENEYNGLENSLKEMMAEESNLWVKYNVCGICGDGPPTEWHHIISQNRCKEMGKPELLHVRSNVIELCKPCHDNTTASLIRKNMPDRKVDNDNVHKEPTESQLNYIEKLDGDIDKARAMNRGGASSYIDELKKLKYSQE